MCNRIVFPSSEEDNAINNDESYYVIHDEKFYPIKTTHKHTSSCEHIRTQYIIYNT